MSAYIKGFVLVCGAVLLGGCATWTPQQTAAFENAMTQTANMADPCEYAGNRACVRPQPVVVPVVVASQTTPQASAYNGRPYTPTW